MSARSRSERHGCFYQLRDIWRGAVVGDFARDKGILGTATQIVFGFLPGIGDICAVRDFIADWRAHDIVGAMLNVLGLVPVFGGFPKAIDALHTAHQIGRVIHLANQQRE